MSDFPKTMTHPAFAPAVLGRGAFEGSPARFPPVTVETPQQEEEYLAKGYRSNKSSESHVVGYAEYPKMMRHPDHEPGTDDEKCAKKEGNEIIQWVIKGKPEKFPHVIANSAAEEKAWQAKGYKSVGGSDPKSFEAAHASPYVPGLVHQEYPKMVNGVLVDPEAGKSTFQKYPMWVGDKIVNNEAEERRARGRDIPEVPMAQPDHAPEPPEMSRGEKIRAGKARKKAEREAQAQQPAA